MASAVALSEAIPAQTPSLPSRLIKENLVWPSQLATRSLSLHNSDVNRGLSKIYIERTSY